MVPDPYAPDPYLGELDYDVAIPEVEENGKEFVGEIEGSLD